MKLYKNSFYKGKYRIAIIFPLLYLVCTLIINILGEKKELAIPVQNTTAENWDKLSFWYYPWGQSGVHKGIDIFAPHKTPIISPVNGMVISSGFSNNGGNYVYIIGPKMRIYYFAHLNTVEIKRFQSVKTGQLIGTVGNTGNAIGTPYHLHFSIFSITPIFKHYNNHQYEGWKKMFYLDPNNLLLEK